MRAILGVGLMVGLAAVAGAKDAPDAKKLVGKWETEFPGGTLVLEFTKDGKLNGTKTADGKVETKTGTYKLEGDKLTVAIAGESEHAVTVVKLTDDALEVKGDGNKGVAFKRVKAK